MNENLTTQIVAALIQDGTIKMSADELTAAIETAVAALPKEYHFRGVAVPRNYSPGSIFEPSLWVAVAGGRYIGFSNRQVQEGDIHFFTSDDGSAWDSILAYSSGGGSHSGGPLVVEGTFGDETYYGVVFHPAETPGNPTFEEAKSCFFAGGVVLLKGPDEYHSSDVTRLVIGHFPAGEDGDFVYDESLFIAGEYSWYKTYNS